MEHLPKWVQEVLDSRINPALTASKRESKLPIFFTALAVHGPEDPTKPLFITVLRIYPDGSSDEVKYVPEQTGPDGQEE